LRLNWINKLKVAVMNERKENIDPDILKGREDILRAHRKEMAGLASNNADPEKQPPRNMPQEPSPIMKAVVDANRQKNPQRGKSDIPAFDVSRKILARQRQSAAAKRTAPLKRRQTEISTPVRIQTRIEYYRPPHNSLVADIVARDIDRFCQGK
jgi:hypothetical protein